MSSSITLPPAHRIVIPAQKPEEPTRAMVGWLSRRFRQRSGARA